MLQNKTNITQFPLYLPLLTVDFAEHDEMLLLSTVATMAPNVDSESIFVSTLVFKGSKENGMQSPMSCTFNWKQLSSFRMFIK